MLRKISWLLLFLLVKFSVALPEVTPNTPQAVCLIKDGKERDSQWLAYVIGALRDGPLNNLDEKKATVEQTLSKYSADSKCPLIYFAESLYQGRLKHTQERQNALTNAIRSADKINNDFLVFKFFNFLAYNQTEEGNVIGAVSSYRMAKKYAVKLNDVISQIVTDINISDVFYKNELYNQSLFYLQQASDLSDKYYPNDQRINNVIYYNKSESFFRLNKLDSLKIYNAKLRKSKAATNKIFTYQNRTGYYLFLLNHQYKQAIGLIRAMQLNGHFDFNDRDFANLSYAYYMDGQIDSAKSVTDHLLSDPAQANHPEIKYHLYSLLAKIAEQRGHDKVASANYKLSLQQAENNMGRITRVNDISSLIKVDELENYYLQKDETYQRQRVVLILAIVFALLVALVITVFYRSVRQKRHYEMLLFSAKKQELAFINSHDVRKHLSNIMGLVDIMCADKNKDNERTKQYLFNSAQNLDKAIKNIAEKIDS